MAVNDSLSPAEQQPLLSKKDIHARRCAEHHLLTALHQTVTKHTDFIRDQLATKAVRGDLFTEDEKQSFNRYQYYAWGRGVLTGGFFFVTVFGGLRYASFRRRKKSGLQLFSMQQQRKNAPQLHELDLPLSLRSQAASSRRTVPEFSKMNKESLASSPASSSSSQSFFQAAPLDASEELSRSLQLLCVGAISFAMVTLTAGANADQPAYFHALSKLPLQPGRSYFCQSACPDLVQQMRTLRHGQVSVDFAKKTTSFATSKRDLNFSTNESTKEFDADELLKDPVLPELESFVQMVYNCQQRMNYQNEIRRQRQSLFQQQQNKSVSDGKDSDVYNEEVIEIPPPGVPLRYVEINTSDEGLPKIA